MGMRDLSLLTSLILTCFLIESQNSVTWPLILDIILLLGSVFDCVLVACGG